MATPEKGKRAITKDKTVGEPEVPPISTTLTVPSWSGNQHPREDNPESREKSPADCHFQPSGSSMQIVRWTRFSAFLRSSSPQPRGQRTESCLGSFPKPGLSHSLVAYWLLLWSLPRAWMLTPVLLILLSSGYCHPSGKVPGPYLDRSVSWLWEGLPQHRPSTLSTEDPLQTHCLLSDLGLSVQSLAQRWELAWPRVLKS